MSGQRGDSASQTLSLKDKGGKNASLGSVVERGGNFVP